MSGRWQTVRVFISSTFRDMHAERDHLIKVVFPAMREELEKHRVHLVDIDLRWGVTREQADNDEALDVCLDQIDACRPFFIGILGERYGYVSSRLPDRVASKYGWIRHHTGKSITELEILYGVLNNPPMHSHALFLFRDNAFLNNVPSDKRKDLEAEDDSSAAKLKNLKQAIRDAHMPVVPYSCEYAGLKTNGDVQLTGLDEFGRQIAAWLGATIKAELKLQDQPATADTDTLADESDFHERFMESRLRVHVGRKSLRNQLAEYADGSQTMPCLVTGASGSGKSAALARFVRVYRRARRDTTVIAHFIGASPASTNPRQMLRRFCLSLKNVFGFVEDIPQDFNDLATLFRGFLTRIPADRRTVFVLDALNQLDETDNAQTLYWLPRELPGHVKPIASCIDDGDQSEPILRAFAHRPYHPVPVPALADHEQRQIIRAVPSLSAKTLDDVQVDLLLSNPATSNPLFLLVTLEELRGFGSFEQLDRRIVEFPHPLEQEPRWHNWLIRAKQAAGSVPDEQKRQAQRARLEQVESALKDVKPADDTLTAVFLQVIDRLESDFDPQVSQKLLSLLASAKEGLSERELQELLARLLPNHDGKRRDEEIQVALRQVRSYLMRKGPLVDFYHRSFWKAVREKYLKTELDRHNAHRVLADYFASAPYRLPTDEAANPPNERKVSELPWQRLQMVCEAGEGKLTTELPSACDRLEQLVEDIFFLEAKTQAGLVFELATEFTQCVTTLPDDRPQRRILKLLDEALRRDIHFIARHAEDYPQGLFQCLWNHAWWYDCREAAQHYEDLQAVLKQPLRWTREGPTLHALLEHWRHDKENKTPAFQWLRSLRPPSVHLGTALQAVLHGHLGQVWDVCFSPDGRCVASGSGDSSVRLWNAESGAQLAVFVGHEGGAKSIAFSPDGAWIASGSGDQTVRLWDVESQTEFCVLRGHDALVESVAFSPSGRWIASGARDKTVRVWDVETRTEVVCLSAHANHVHCVAFSPDGRRIAAWSDSGFVSVSLEGQCWAEQGTLGIWDAETGVELAAFGGHYGPFQRLDYTPDGRRIACASYDGTVRIWDTMDGTELAVLRGDGQIVLSVSFSSDGRRIATGALDGTVRLWDLETKPELAIFRGHTGPVTSVSFARDGRRIASASDDGTVRLWDADCEIELASLHAHEADVWIVSCSPDGRQVASVGRDKTIRLWDAQSGTQLAVLRGHESEITNICFSSDGHRIASSSDDGTVRVWDAGNGNELGVLRGHEERVTTVVFSPDGQRIVSGSADNTIRIWDAANNKELAILRGHADVVTSVSYSPDGKRIVSKSFDNTIRFWNAGNGIEEGTLRGHESTVTSVSFSSDSRRVASGSWDKTVRLWDAESAVQLAVLRGHVHWVEGVLFSPDDKCIASSDNTTLRLWDGESGQCLEVFHGAGDIAAFARRSTLVQPRLRAIVDGGETIVTNDKGRPLARFPAALWAATTSSLGCFVFGGFANHLYMFKLEGTDTHGSQESR